MTEKIRCIHDDIEVERISEAKKVLGKGQPIPYKHKFLYDEGGNPYCGKNLTEADVEHYTEADTEAEV